MYSLPRNKTVGNKDSILIQFKMSASCKVISQLKVSLLSACLSYSLDKRLAVLFPVFSDSNLFS